MADEKQPPAMDPEKARLADENRKHRAAEKAAKDKAAAEAAAKKAEDDKELERLREENATLSEGLGVYRERDEAAAEALFSALPKERQDHLTMVKDSLSPEKWLAFLQREASQEDGAQAAEGGEGDGPPPRVSRGDGRVSGSKEYKVQNAEWIRNQMGVDEVRHLPTLQVEDEGLGTRFYMGIRQFMRTVRSNPGVFLDKQNKVDRKK